MVYTASSQFEDTEEGLMLCGVPRLLEGHCPWWPGLPLYILKLATEVHLIYFRTKSKVLPIFYTFSDH